MSSPNEKEDKEFKQETIQKDRKKSRKKENNVDGEIVFVEEEKVPLTVSHTTMDRDLRPKKPLSEKQQANLQRLIELNKTRREEKLSSVAKEKMIDPKTFQVPKEIDEGMVPIVVKAKREYKKKESQESRTRANDVSLEDRLEKLQLEINLLNSGGNPKESNGQSPKESKKMKRKPKVKIELPSDSESESEIPSDTETDTDVELHKIKKRINKRQTALKELDNTIKQSSKYSNLSVF
jgi:hypothetical protein